MRRTLTSGYPGPGGMFFVSFLVHAAAIAVIIGLQLFEGEFRPDQTPVTYVDMVTLPVAEPQAGTPAPAAEKDVEAPPQPSPPPPQKPAMVQPVPPAKPAKPAASVPPAPAPGKAAKADPAAEARAFEERMARIEQQAQDKRQADVLDRLRKRGRQTGMPTAKGSEAGSDYPSYLQSRLKDALREVMVSQTKAPQVIATITVSPDGRISDYHVEKGSGDPLFDDAVHRAVTLAGKSLVPPPGGAQFRRIFRFRPEGVGIK